MFYVKAAILSKQTVAISHNLITDELVGCSEKYKNPSSHYRNNGL